ncbi:MAG: ABC transporter substrate-binding protein [Bdellovibrionota bacterium]
MLQNSFTQKLLVVAALISFASGCTRSASPDGSGRKVVRIPMGDDPKGADPAQANDQVSAELIGYVFEGLLQFSYLGPAGEVEASLAESLPILKDKDTTLVFRIRKNIVFQDDPAFPDGKGRGVVADDFVYSFKRIADPKLASSNWWMFDGMILGLNEWREALKTAKPEDFQKLWDSDVAGLKATDPYTLQIKLTRSYPQLFQILSMAHASVVSREVVAKYGPEIVSHPVGTGAYRLKEWRRGSKIILEKNPTYREVLYPSIGTNEERQKGLLEASGKKLPFIDEIDFDIFKEEQPRWLSFLAGNLDLTGIPKDNFVDTIDASGDIKKEFIQKGFRLEKTLSLTSWWIEFNLKDAVLGKNKKLRQALAHAFDRERALELLYNNRGRLAGGPITPTLEGGEGIPQDAYKYDVEVAKKLMSEAGFPDGKGLPEFTFDLRGAGSTNRQLAELVQENFAKVGVKLKVVGNSFSEALSKQKEARFQVMLGGWAGDYPDPENFLQNFYGPNAAPGPNSSNLTNSEYDKLYEKMRTMRPNPERVKAIVRMNQILAEEVPVIFFYHSMSYTVYRSWLQNFKPHEFLYGTAKYWDIDLETKKKVLN